MLYPRNKSVSIIIKPSRKQELVGKNDSFNKKKNLRIQSTSVEQGLAELDITKVIHHNS